MSRWLVPTTLALSLALAGSASAQHQFQQCTNQVMMPGVSASYIKKPRKPACLKTAEGCSAEETAAYDAAVKKYEAAQKSRLSRLGDQAKFAGNYTMCSSMPPPVANGRGFDE